MDFGTSHAAYLARIHQDELLAEARGNQLVKLARSGDATPARSRARDILAWPVERYRALFARAGASRPAVGSGCRLPDGRQGHVALVFNRGEWALVCRAAE
jgi:hypothetical protein